MDQKLFYDVTVNLRAAYPQQVQFDKELALLDSDEVPIYDRVRVITPDAVSDLEEGGDARAIATAFFGQADKADQLILARVAKTAIPPAFVCGTVDTTAANWAALGASATFTVTDSDTNSTVVTCGPFTGVTSFSQVLPILNAGLADLSSPDVVGLDSAEFALDYAGKPVLNMPAGQDDGDPTITITYSATPATIAYLLGVQSATDGESVSGNAVETLLTARAAAKNLLDGYNVALLERGGASNDDEIVALAAQIQTERHQMTIVDGSSHAPDAGETDDLQSRLSTLGYDRTTVIYSSHSDYPDFAADGAFLPADPGSRSYGHTPLTGVLASGSVGPDNDLTPTEKAALDAKGCNYVVTTGGYTFVHRGKTAGGVEKRMKLGADWLEANIQNDLQALDMNEDLLGFDKETLGAIDGIFRRWLDIGVERRLISDYEITLPTVEEFTAAEKASGDMSLVKAFRANGIFEAHTFTINGSIDLG
jgi:hypothetical protein